MFIFPAAREGITSLQRSLRVNPFTNTHTRTHTKTHVYTHLVWGVKVCPGALLYHFTFTGVVDFSFWPRGIYIYIYILIFPSRCWQLCLQTRHQSHLCWEKVNTREKERWFTIGDFNITVLFFVFLCGTKRIFVIMSEWRVCDDI